MASPWTGWKKSAMNNIEVKQNKNAAQKFSISITRGMSGVGAVMGL